MFQRFPLHQRSITSWLCPFDCFILIHKSKKRDGCVLKDGVEKQKRSEIEDRWEHISCDKDKGRFFFYKLHCFYSFKWNIFTWSENVVTFLPKPNKRTELVSWMGKLQLVFCIFVFYQTDKSCLDLSEVSSHAQLSLWKWGHDGRSWHVYFWCFFPLLFYVQLPTLYLFVCRSSCNDFNWYCGSGPVFLLWLGRKILLLCLLLAKY